MRHWLFKSEPDCYSFTDLENAPGQTTSWDGVPELSGPQLYARRHEEGGFGILLPQRQES